MNFKLAMRALAPKPPLRATAVAIAVLCGSAAAANAANIAITNAGFESIVLADGTDTPFATAGDVAIAGWWLNSNGPNGGGATFNPAAASTIFPGGVPEGANAAYAALTSLTQALSATLLPGGYVLSAMIGNPADRPDAADPAIIQLYLPDTGRVLFASAPVSPGQIPNGSFVEVSASGTIAANDADLGKQLGIRLIAGGPPYPAGPYYAFDDVRLDVSPVPEPASYAMLGCGLALLVWRRQRSNGSAC